ncbi:hypothetical protein CONPUDRAFT_148151 [Coniophora puteana RWD-64-598 SS2]|uniref:Ribonuclease H1 N-terminal domain-containing protein n=1 Tax=Coniophora puteana (strain RWD-64-598) TaxID=741705 RepID=A0A5M3N446_CONPW|nr:uncharacterized protein CONPUDRAFT_148151 [Coniophora puteana RWD-64-598 SS2]EIW86027.1 hypothetical protein CONPUDRAFT_148151 [Coniophora puteana RWD-64-598 SS2]
MVQERYESARGRAASISSISTESSITQPPSAVSVTDDIHCSTPVVVRTRTTEVTTTESPGHSQTIRTSRTVTTYHSASVPASPSPHVRRPSVSTTPASIHSPPGTPRPRSSCEPASRVSGHTASLLAAPRTPSARSRSFHVPNTNTRPPSVPSVPSHAHRTLIPHPNYFRKPNYHVKRFYVITRGQEVGIYDNWHDVSERTTGMTSNKQSHYSTFEEALAVYTQKYEDGKLEPIPVRGGPFWRQAPSSSSPSEASVQSRASDEFGIRPEDDISSLMLQLSVEEANGGPSRRNI